jgi:hypothetical protein
MMHMLSVLRRHRDRCTTWQPDSTFQGRILRLSECINGNVQMPCRGSRDVAGFDVLCEFCTSIIHELILA